MKLITLLIVNMIGGVFFVKYIKFRKNIHKVMILYS